MRVPSFAWRRKAPTLGMLIASFAAGGHAEAACTPPSPLNDTTVTCSGTTINQNGTTGYGSATDVGNTYNIQPGASVAGTDIGLRFQNNGTVNNSGVISGAGTNGVFILLEGVVNNAGQIFGSGATGDGVTSFSVGDVTNSGGIRGSRFGVRLQNGQVTNTGTIIGSTGDGVRITDIAKVSNTGDNAFISGGVNGINIGPVNSTSNVEISNSGTIRGGANGILSLKTLDLTNSGEISATSAGGNGINASVVHVTNASTGNISGDIGILTTAGGTSTSTVSNGGTISGTSFGLFMDNATVINSGSIVAGPGGDAITGTALDVTNSGLISTTGAGSRAIDAGTSSAIVKNSGTISSDSFAIHARTVAVTNSGVISGSIGIFGDGDATIANSGTGIISGTVNGIRAAGVANLVNSGTISGNGNGVQGNIGVVADNAGTISGGTNGSGIVTDGIAAVSNRVAGVIRGGVTGIDAGTANVVNAGTISGNIGIRASDLTRGSNIDNAGTITGVAVGVQLRDGTMNNAGTINVTNFSGVTGRNLTVTNTGTIFGGPGGFTVGAGNVLNLNNSGRLIEAPDQIAISAVTANVTNSGTVSGGSRVISANNIAFVNTGAVAGTESAIFGDQVSVSNSGSIIGGSSGVNGGSTVVTNSGTISGGIGIQAAGAANITNSGTIIGTGGTAIKLSNAADTLTLISGSRIVGVVDMGFGADVVNAFVVAPNTRVSSLTTLVLPTFINFTGTLNTSFSGGGFNGPAVHSGLQLATLDPTALAQTDRTLMDFTGGVSSLLRGRIDDTASSGGSPAMAMAYAPEAGNGGPFTKTRGANPTWGNAAPITVWSSSFGGQRIQDETASTLRANSTAWGAAIGIDRRLRPDWLVGAFIGGGAGGLSVALNSQTVNTDYVFAGGYSRFEWASQFVDVTLQGGGLTNKSKRLVLNNLVPETASASYNGWFVSPEVSYGFRHQIGNGYVLMPTARLRYVAGLFDGFGETGSAQTLTVRGRTLQNVEERGELDVSRTMTFFGGEHALKTNVHGGVIAQQRVGDSSVSTVLIGQNLVFATPGKGGMVGAVAGAGFDYRIRANVAVFGAIEGVAMSDQSRIGTAKGGVRVAF